MNVDRALIEIQAYINYIGREHIKPTGYCSVDCDVRGLLVNHENYIEHTVGIL